MSRKKRNKPQKIVVTKKVPDNEAIKLISDKVDRFTEAMRTKVEELIDKHNSLATELDGMKKLQQQLAVFTAQEFGKQQAKQQDAAERIGKSLEHLDLNVLTTAEILKEVFGQLSQIDYMLQHASVPAPDASGPMKVVLPDIPEADIAGIKSQAETWFTEVVGSAFRAVHERIMAEEKARFVAEQKAKEEAEKAAKDKTEAELMETELKGDSGIQQIGAGGLGVDIPEGADVFGGV